MKQSSVSGRQHHKNKLTITFDSSIKRISRRSSGWFFGSELMHFANAILLANIPPARGAGDKLNGLQRHQRYCTPSAQNVRFVI